MALLQCVVVEEFALRVEIPKSWLLTPTAVGALFPSIDWRLAIEGMPSLIN